MKTITKIYNNKEVLVCTLDFLYNPANRVCLDGNWHYDTLVVDEILEEEQTIIRNIVIQ